MTPTKVIAMLKKDEKLTSQKTSTGYPIMPGRLETLKNAIPDVGENLQNRYSNLQEPVEPAMSKAEKVLSIAYPLLGIVEAFSGKGVDISKGLTNDLKSSLDVRKEAYSKKLGDFKTEKSDLEKSLLEIRNKALEQKFAGEKFDWEKGEAVSKREQDKLMKEMEMQQKSTEKGTEFERQKELERLKAGLRPPKEPKPVYAGLDPTTGKPYTSGQVTAAKFSISMGRALDNIDKLVENGFDEASLTNQVVNTFKKKTVLNRFDFLNIAKTPEQRRYLQAQLDFMVPHLRDQSGAAINADEYVTETMQYMPNVGDTAEEIAQKRDARIGEFAARRSYAGGMYDQMLNAGKEEVARRTKPVEPSSTFSPDKQKRLEELRAKRDAGTLGK
jgi:hypothetical protein